MAPWLDCCDVIVTTRLEACDAVPSLQRHLGAAALSRDLAQMAEAQPRLAGLGFTFAGWDRERAYTGADQIP